MVFLQRSSLVEVLSSRSNNGQEKNEGEILDLSCRLWLEVWVVVFRW